MKSQLFTVWQPSIRSNSTLSSTLKIEPNLYHPTTSTLSLSLSLYTNTTYSFLAQYLLPFFCSVCTVSATVLLYCLHSICYSSSTVSAQYMLQFFCSVCTVSATVILQCLLQFCYSFWRSFWHGEHVKSGRMWASYYTYYVVNYYDASLRERHGKRGDTL